MDRTFVIDCFPESALRYRDDYAIIVIDVIRATTTATTAVSFGRKVFPVQTTDSAFILADKMPDAILVGELGGNVPYGFHMTNSPLLVEALDKVPCGSLSDPQRPIILLSSSGTQLLFNAAGAKAAYLACFRNYSAVAACIPRKHNKVAILGAGTRGQFRREDQMGCAWVAEKLMAEGFRAESTQTAEIVERWRGVAPAILREGRSADYLRKSGQVADLEFILHHLDDLNTVPVLHDGELVKVDVLL
jgi:2-phosphosulfolactate phosphatase